MRELNTYSLEELQELYQRLLGDAAGSRSAGDDSYAELLERRRDEILVAIGDRVIDGAEEF